jgi:hypothetical protein
MGGLAGDALTQAVDIQYVGCMRLYQQKTNNTETILAIGAASFKVIRMQVADA